MEVPHGIVADVGGFFPPQLHGLQPALEGMRERLPQRPLVLSQDDHLLKAATQAQRLQLAALAGRMPLGDQAQPVSLAQCLQGGRHIGERRQLRSMLAVYPNHLFQPGLDRKPVGMQQPVEGIPAYP